MHLVETNGGRLSKRWMVGLDTHQSFSGTSIRGHVGATERRRGHNKDKGASLFIIDEVNGPSKLS